MTKKYLPSKVESAFNKLTFLNHIVHAKTELKPIRQSTKKEYAQKLGRSQKEDFSTSLLSLGNKFFVPLNTDILA